MVSLRKCFNSAISMSRSLCRSHILCPKFKQNVNAVRHYGQAYEGEGKTHAVLLNDEGSALMINSYSEIGFTLNNGLSVIGPMAIFPNVVLSWNVGDVTHINEETLSLFLLLEPKLDILILGVSDYNKRSRETVNSLASLVRKFKIQVEVMATEIACPTFNFLHAEQRFVGAGIIPPLHITGQETAALGPKLKLGYVHPDAK